MTFEMSSDIGCKRERERESRRHTTDGFTTEKWCQRVDIQYEVRKRMCGSEGANGREI
jgi:hypothetical protein